MYRNTFALSTFFFFSTRKKKNFILLFLWYTDQYYELAMNSLQLPKLTLISYFGPHIRSTWHFINRITKHYIYTSKKKKMVFHIKNYEHERLYSID